MGRLRSHLNEVKRLKARMLGNDVVKFRLEDGTEFVIGRMEAFTSLYGYFGACLTADYRREPRPEAPGVLRAIAEAEDREWALEIVMGGYSFLPVDEDALVQNGALVPAAFGSVGPVGLEEETTHH